MKIILGPSGMASFLDQCIRCKRKALENTILSNVHITVHPVLSKYLKDNFNVFAKTGAFQWICLFSGISAWLLNTGCLLNTGFTVVISVSSGFQAN